MKDRANIVCPYCKKKHVLILIEHEASSYECFECHKLFLIRQKVTVVYTTYKIEGEDEKTSI
jgi:transposase-like protein